MRQTQNFAIEAMAGFTTFLSMSYIIIVNPTILLGAGMPFGSVLLATCFSAAIASFLVGRFVNLPTALAPAMGINAFFASFVNDHSLHWSDGLFICFFVGLIVTLLSFKNLRIVIMNSIPPSIVKAVSAGIGALLFTAAVKSIDPNILETATTPSTEHTSTWVICISVFLAMFSLYFLLQRLSEQERACNNMTKAGFLELGAYSTFLFSILISALLLYWIGDHNVNGNTVGKTEWLWYEIMITDTFFESNAELNDLLVFSIIIFYTLIINFAGSPYRLAKDSEWNNKFDVDWRTAIPASFKVESTCNIFAPIAGTASLAYYSENFSGIIAGGRSGAVTYIVGLCFLIVGCVFYIFGDAANILLSLVPPESTAPVIAMVGVLILHNSMKTSIYSDAFPEKLDERYQLIPAAISIAVTPLFDFQMGISTGLIAFMLLWMVYGKPEPATERNSEPEPSQIVKPVPEQSGHNGWLYVIIFLAVISLLPIV